MEDFRINSQETILCAAIHYDDGKAYKAQPKNIETGYVWCGRRHHNIINLRSEITGEVTRTRQGQGFITSHDRFVDRKEGWKIALAAGQVKDRETNEILDKHFPGDDHILTSEDLY